MGHSSATTFRGADVDLEMANQIAEAMQALATPSRVLILARLLESSCSVTELAEAVGMEQSAVSHQLRILRLLRLVVGERDGRNVLYALHDSHVGVLLEESANHVAHLRLADDEAAFAE
ncbi:MAG: helix-turn-helix transcriptional regulator [Actinobacteria bacterium]|nr:helix-turn-helix transcriptional regulator [Actinomycetota bacterium]